MDLSKLAAFADLHSVLPEDPEPIEEFLSRIRSEENKHGYYRTLKAFYRFLKKRYRLSNPIEVIEPPRRPKKIMATLELVELMQLLYSATTLRDKAILTLLVDTGMRSSELASLRKKDIGQETVTVKGKSGQRQIPISDETRRLLLTLIAQNDKDDFVFHGHRGPISRKGVYRVVRAHMEKAGISGPKLGGHRIRHAFGKGYLVSGGDLRSLQELMGHSDITTTQKYASLNLNDTIRKHHTFSPLRAARAAAQESFFDTNAALKEVEEILKQKKPGNGGVKREKILATKKSSYGETPLLPGLSVE